MKKVLLKIFSTVIAIAHFSPAFASEAGSPIDEIDHKYKTGYCTTLLNSGVYNDEMKRIYLLAAREDILGFLIGKDALSSEWIGNISTFQIGRNVNTAFFEFANHAESSTEIKNILKKDNEDISSTLKKIDYATILVKNGFAAVKYNPSLMTITSAEEKKAKSLEIALNPIYCHIYQIVMDENSPTAIDFKTYSRNVQMKAASDVREALQKSIQELGY